MTKEEKLARKQQRKAEKVGLGKLLLWNSSSCSVALSTLMLGYVTFYCTDEMVAFMKSVSPKDGVGVMAYTLSKRAMNYYTSLKAVELGKRGIRVNALLPGSTDTGMKKEFEKMAGGQDNLIKENGGAGRLATPQEMADPLLFLNSGMAAFVSGLLLIADMGHNCEKTLGFCKNQLDVPAALKLYNTKFFQNKLKTNQ